MIVDAHCHVWPDHIAATVLAGRQAGLDARHDGTIAGLRRTMDRAGIDRAVCLGVARAARTVQRTNEFIGSIDRTRFVPFGTVHPDLSPAVNLGSLRDNGISGVKLHPLFQDLSLADPRVVDIAAALAKAGITVITHVGAAETRMPTTAARPGHCVRCWTRCPACRSSPATSADTTGWTRPRICSSDPAPSWKPPGRRAPPALTPTVSARSSPGRRRPRRVRV